MKVETSRSWLRVPATGDRLVAELYLRTASASGTYSRHYSRQGDEIKIEMTSGHLKKDEVAYWTAGNFPHPDSLFSANAGLKTSVIVESAKHAQATELPVFVVFEHTALGTFYVQACVLPKADFPRQSTELVLSLSDDNCMLFNPMTVHVEQFADDDFVASLRDAHVAASGDARESAVRMLQVKVLDTFKYLASIGAERLGPVPRRQLEVLRSYIRERP